MRILTVLILVLFTALVSEMSPRNDKILRAAEINQFSSNPVERLENPDREIRNWMSHGRSYSEQRYSPLKQVNDTNVSKLGFAWYYDLDDHNVVEATPIVVDGIMYVTGAMGKVYAMEATTGREIWYFDPRVPPKTLVLACCQPVNRGVAFWKDKVFVGALDGRLIALDAQSGEKVWERMTTDPTKPYTITGAPRV
ncbi:uncharacterized protein METZ01_LOCUS479373, partial [marine metagenome]